MARRNDSSSRFLPTETIFSYSMYSGSMDCRVCSNNIKGIVMREERMKGNRGRKEEVAETKALYTVFCGDEIVLEKEKRLGKEGRSLEHAIFHLVTRTSPLHRIFFHVYFRCRRK